VCLKVGDRLRGCFGSLRPLLPRLADEIVQNAIAAACWDERFRPVTSSELARLAVTVDVVTTFEVADPRMADWDPSRYGLQLREGGRVLATLLPGLIGVHSTKEQIDLALSKARLTERPADLAMERFTTERLPAPDPIPLEPCEAALTTGRGSRG
jgi:AMMECR1 domain-containing protein